MGCMQATDSHAIIPAHPACLCCQCRWTQWIFLQLFHKGLAYQAEVPVNWCPALGTVLANEEVIDGKSERGGHPVQRMPMKQVRGLLGSLEAPERDGAGNGCY